MKRNRSCGRIAVKVQQVIDCLDAYIHKISELYTDSWLSSAYKAMLAHLIAGLRVTICKKTILLVQQTWLFIPLLPRT